MCKLYFDIMRKVIASRAENKASDPLQHITGEVKTRLRHLAEDTQEHVLTRVLCKLILGDADSAEAFRSSMRQAHKLMVRATDQDKQGSVHNFDNSNDASFKLTYTGQHPVAQVFSGFQKATLMQADTAAFFEAARSEMPMSGSISPEQWAQAMAYVFSAPDREKAKREIVAQYGAQSFEELGRAATAHTAAAAASAGMACDSCGKKAASAPLQTCAKCGMVWYCSRDCQKADWKAHKSKCKAPAEWKQGDFVRLKGGPKDPNQNVWLVLDEDRKGGLHHYHVLQYVQDRNGVSSTIAPRQDQVRSVHGSQLYREAMWARMIENGSYPAGSAPLDAARALLPKVAAMGLLRQ